MNPTLKKLAHRATDKNNFSTIQKFGDFARELVAYLNTQGSLQATIVCVNETQYRILQFGETEQYRLTRPINSNLIYSGEEVDNGIVKFFEILKNIRDIEKTEDVRSIIRKTIYTMQQSVGVALDALPVGQSNTARKIAGDLFEQLIIKVFQSIDINCDNGVVKLPVIIDGEIAFDMRYQHDLIIKQGNDIKLLGSVKTTSKDRIDKIFLDKFLHNKLIGHDTPHIAIFLNDIQRKSYKQQGKYGVSSTFLSGHFKGFTVKLNPLDGVYYCDIRPNMREEDILKDHIFEIDKLFLEDIWQFIDK